MSRTNSVEKGEDSSNPRKVLETLLKSDSSSVRDKILAASKLDDMDRKDRSGPGSGIGSMDRASLCAEIARLKALNTSK